MANRICLATGIAVLRTAFGIPGEKTDARHPKHWNLAPGQSVPIIRYDHQRERRRIEFMRWGLVSSWLNGTAVVRSHLDIRARLSAGKADAAGGFRRCLIPADVFFERRASDNQLFAVALASRQFMTLAGLWSEWVSPSGVTLSCFAILTTDPNPALAPLCKRMPAILSTEQWEPWLAPKLFSTEQTSRFLKPFAGEPLIAWPVDRRIRTAKNDDPRLLEVLAKS
jgi:putative SOS response-associated peptidase YedK